MMKSMLDRRRFLGGVGVAAAIGTVGVRRELGGDLATALAPFGIRPGARFGTCVVTSTALTQEGALAIAMRGSDDRRFQLEILRHDPRTPGVAQAGRLDVFVNNGGRGDTATDEEHGLAAMALARHLALHPAVPGALSFLPTLAERAMGVAFVRG
jgi:hypothetical protein